MQQSVINTQNCKFMHLIFSSGAFWKHSEKATTWEDQPCFKTTTTAPTTITSVAPQETCDVYIRGKVVN